MPLLQERQMDLVEVLSFLLMLSTMQLCQVFTFYNPLGVILIGIPRNTLPNT